MLICCDVDHTLRLSFWRDHMIETATASGFWDDYHALGVQDEPATAILQLVIALNRCGHEIYIVTAIPRKWKRSLFSWLHKNGILVEEDHMLMRPDDALRPSVEIKQELVSHLAVDLFIDDREDVCAAFGKAGIHTLQCRLAS